MNDSTIIRLTGNVLPGESPGFILRRILGQSEIVLRYSRFRSGMDLQEKNNLSEVDQFSGNSRLQDG